jgi:hypothetical protein
LLMLFSYAIAAIFALVGCIKFHRSRQPATHVTPT